MKIFTRILFLALFSALAVAMPANAQHKASLTGKITTADTKQPVAYALVDFPNAKIQAVTDGKGIFSVKAIAEGKHNVVISYLGYETIDTILEVKSGRNDISLEMTPANFRVDDVVVTAEAGKAGAATSSTISRTAMDHIQATSLSDIMSLLPGASTPTGSELALTSMRSFGVRGGSSLGTAIIVDGTPLSNNSNMQSMSAAMGSEAVVRGAGATPSSGIDMRQISTDNIESVEVIRGIASVEYGDITSGAVIVNQRTGRAPLDVKLTMNPNLYQVSATHGVQLGDKIGAGAINYSADYTYSQYKPTEGYSHYERINGSAGYTNSVGKWYTNTTLSLGLYRDKTNPTPGDPNDFERGLQKENRFRINTKGTFSFNEGWFKNIKYAASFTYTDKDSYYEDMAGNAESAISTSKSDGAVNTSVSQSIKLEDGSTLQTGGDRAWKTPNAYAYNYTVRGKELNTYAQVIANFSGDLGPTSHYLKVGADFKSDGNRGDGKIYDENNPPFRSVSYEFATQRERSYSEIPFMNTLGLFAEESFNLKVAQRNLNIVAGVRYDKVFDFDDAIAPRINASLEILPDEKLVVRGGFGVTAKTPTLAMLYPQEAYFDILNFDNSNSTAASDRQKFQIITTRVFNTENPNLEMATAKKYEVGVDFKIGQVSASFTAFQDICNNGYSFSKTEDTFKSIDFVKYSAAEYNEDGTTLPTLSEASRSKILVSYTTPTNNSTYNNKGIEAYIDFGRINAIRTRFILDGVWSYGVSQMKGYSFDRASASNNTDHMGVFANNGKHYSEMLSTNLKVVHNIPSIGFVVSATANVTWLENSWSHYYNDEMPIKYISAKDGKMYDFNESMLEQDEFKFLDVRDELNVKRNIKDSYMSPLLCINVNVTKEIKDYLRISFYANNAFRSTPMWESTKTPGNFIRRNEDNFFFGLSLTATIK